MLRNDKAKPAKKQRRKATGLSFGFEYSRAANKEISLGDPAIFLKKSDWTYKTLVE